MSKMQTLYMKLGTVVTLKAHSNHVSLRSPYMVVTEVVKESKRKEIYNPQTGEEIASRIKYCCLWYNYAKAEFKTQWFYDYVLTKGVIGLEQKKLEIKSVNIGNVLELKNLRLELERSKSISSLKNQHNFIPPLLTVSGFTKAKELPLYNTKTQEQIRWHNTERIKCLYYNHVKNTFSEYHFTPEVLVSV